MTPRIRRLVYLSSFFFTSAFAKSAYAQGRPCPALTNVAQQLRSEAAQFITLSGWADLRTSLGITTGDTSNLGIVVSDSVCEALTAVKDSISGTVSSNAFMVVQFQSFFAAA